MPLTQICQEEYADAAPEFVADLLQVNTVVRTAKWITSGCR